MDKGDFVKISLTGWVKGGDVFETMDEDVARDEGIYDEEAEYGPKVVVLGEDQLLPGLEEALLGAEPGDASEVEVPPEEGFGEREDDKIVSMSKREYESRFDEPPRRGQQVDLQGQTGVIVSTVGGHVRVDFNHPLAGETVVYEYEVLERIDDPEEKVKAILDNSTESGIDSYEVDIENSHLSIEKLDPEMPDRGWLFSKGQMAQRAFSGLDEVEEVEFVETFERPLEPSPEEMREPLEEGG